MITVQGVSMRYGSKVLFEDVTATFSAGRRYGLTGPNGAGKSTFMKLLTGELPPQQGHRRPARRSSASSGRTSSRSTTSASIDTVDHGQRAAVGARSRSARRLYAKGADMTDDDGMRLGELEGIVGEEDGYTRRERRRDPAAGPRHPGRPARADDGELQGGQKVRVLLAQALFGHPQALLLDEPTNHLDLDSIHWLREFLVRYDGTLIVISHDRHFLNAVCTHMADIDYQTIITYTGGYDDMVARQDADPLARRVGERAAREEDRAAERLHRALRRRHARQPGAVAPQGSRAAADDRAGAVEHPAAVHQVHDEPAVRAARDGVLGRLEGVRRTTRSSPTSSAIVNRGEKIVLVGRNGVGKTTLLKALLADAPSVPPSTAATSTPGPIRWGHEVSIGYFPQDHTGHDPEGHDRRRVAAPVRPGRARGRTSTACSARCCSAARRG